MANLKARTEIKTEWMWWRFAAMVWIKIVLTAGQTPVNMNKVIL